MKRRLIITALILAGILSGPGSQACSPEITQPVEPITLAYAPFESTALVWIAEDQGFFTDNGLEITYRKYDAGALAVGGVVNGEADIAIGIAEYPVVGRAFQRAKISIIGNADKANLVYIIARKDRGISQVADLKGKTVGTTFGTVAHFHLGRFLALNGVRLQDVTLVDVKTPDEWVNAVADGKIDAIATAQPYATRAAERLGDNSVVWEAQSSQLLHGLIISGEDWITNHPGAARRFLESLNQAEDFLINNAAKSKDIIQQRLELDPAYMATVWSQNRFGLSLDQSLILAMEDEARWMISNNLTTEKTVPNFLDFIREDALKEVKPKVVNIIR